MTTPYRPDPAFAGLFRVFTSETDSIGAVLTRRMGEQAGNAGLLVSTASDIAYWSGHGAVPRIESFRKSTRGFIELTAVSHVPLALAYIARLREMGVGEADWRHHLAALMTHCEHVREANCVRLWKEDVALTAFDGRERKIANMVEYTLATSVAYIRRALEAPALLDFDALIEQYLDPAPELLPVSMDDVMFATFGLAYVDIAYRIGAWIRDCGIDWPTAMVLVSGRSGRPTAGIDWSSNNMCNLIWKASGEALAPERLYVAPHAPGFSVANLPDASGLATLEQTYRDFWCTTRASVEVSRRMFPDSPAYEHRPAAMDAMPAIASVADRRACMARLRRIMEDPRQLLSNCVSDYVVEQLGLCGNRPENVLIPGFSNVEFPDHARDR